MGTVVLCCAVQIPLCTVKKKAHYSPGLWAHPKVITRQEEDLTDLFSVDRPSTSPVTIVEKVCHYSPTPFLNVGCEKTTMVHGDKSVLRGEGSGVFQQNITRFVDNFTINIAKAIVMLIVLNFLQPRTGLS